MNKLVSMVLAAAVAVPLFAQEPALVESEALPKENAPRESTVWPAFFAICEYPASADLIGLRLTIPFSTRQENVTGIDIGFWGRSIYFEGIQINVFRNDVKDDLSGFQVGLYNTAGGADLLGLQVGLWNQTGHMRGFQAGLVNYAGEARGLQVGLINRCETMYGYQVGLINIIRDAEVQFFPIVNIGF